MKFKVLILLVLSIVLLSIPSEQTQAGARFSTLPDFFGFDDGPNSGSWGGGAEATCDAVTIYVSYPGNENPIGIPGPIYDYVDWSLLEVRDKDSNVIPSETGLIHRFLEGTPADQQQSNTFNFTNPLEAGQSYYLILGYNIVGGALGGGSGTFEMGAVGNHPYWQLRIGDTGNDPSQIEFFCDPSIESDPPTVSILGDTLELEGSGAVVHNVTLTLDKPVNAPVIVDLESTDAAELPAYSFHQVTFNGYGTRGIQYGDGLCQDDPNPFCILPTYSTVTIPPNQTSLTVPVTLFGDTTNTEDVIIDSNYDIRIIRAGNALIGGTSQVSMRQRNDDPCETGPDPGVCFRILTFPGGGQPEPTDDVTFLVDNIIVNEDAGNAVFTVTLSKPNPLASLEISYATTSNGRTAVAGVDYVDTSGSITFTSGQTSLPVSVPLILNPEAELRETFGITFAKVGTELAESATVGALIVDVYDACPDGTAGNDTLVCEGNPPVGTNGDDIVTGFGGADNIMINQNITINELIGDYGVGTASPGNGSNDTLIVNGATNNGIIGDGLEGANLTGGNDTITVGATGSIGDPQGLGNILGDDVVVTSGTGTGGNDIIQINGAVQDGVLGDVVVALGTVTALTGGNDQITINASVGSNVAGDYISGDTTRNPGQDTITVTTNGSVGGDIHGDWVEDPAGGPGLTGEGAADTINIAGTVSGSVFAEGGDDDVNLQDGANGGVDNILALDGGDGFDTLDFAFTALSQQEFDTLFLQDPANGSVTIGGQTFNFTNFERLSVDNTLLSRCPDGTSGADTFVCVLSPPIDSNLDNSITTDAGADNVTVRVPIEGTINMGADNDTLVLEDGTTGGADNILAVDGGSETDTLDFAFTGITDQQAVALLAEDPANGSFVHNSQTYNFTNFENILLSNYVASNLVQFAPMGTITTGYGNPIYSWSDTEVSDYELYVARVDGAQIVNTTVASSSVCNGSTCQIDLTTLAESNRLTNGAHQWYVREAGGAWIGAMDFTLEAPVPDIVTLETTTNLNTIQPSLNWSLSGNATFATYFNVYLASTNGQVLINTWFTRAQTCGDVNGTACSMIPTVTLTNGSSYELYIRSYGPGGTSTGGIGGYAGPENFTIDVPLPDLIAPLGTVDFPQGNPTYSWTHVSGADYYYLYVAGSGGQIINEVIDAVGYCNSTTCQIDPTTLRDNYRLPNGSYTWLVRAWDDGSIAPWSNPGNFIIQSDLPGVVTKISPLQDEISPYSTTFVFNEVANATGYNLVLVDPNGVSGGVIRSAVGDEVVCGAGTCGWNYTLDEIPGQWTWYVAAYNAAGDGPYSAGGLADGYGAVNFYAPTAIPGIITQLSPANEAVVTDDDITFEWVHDADATAYELYLAGPNAYVDYQTYVVGSSVTCSTNCTLDLMVPTNGAYTWYVRGTSAGGLGDWNTGFAFAVDTMLPGVIVKNNPTEAANLTQLAVSFEWQHDADATLYEIYITGPAGYIFSETRTAVGFDCDASVCDPTIILPTNGEYTWYVRGGNAAGFGLWDAAEPVSYGDVTFTVAEAVPGIVNKVAPLTDAELDNLEVLFSWTRASADRLYEFVVVGPNDFVNSEILGDDESLSGALGCNNGETCEHTVILPENGVYTWYIRAFNDAGAGLWSVGEASDGYGGQVFTIGQTLPGAITKTGPLNAEVVPTLDVIFDWTHDLDASLYEIYLLGPDGYINYAPYTVGTDVICSTTCALQITVPQNGAYTWYLRGGNDAGFGTWSVGEAADNYGATTFTVALPLPGAPTLNTPLDETIIYQTNRPTFSWDAVTTATYYNLQIMNGMGLVAYEAWHEASAICVGGICTFQIPNPLAYGSYDWRVQAYNVAGIGPYSTSNAFLSLSFNIQPLMVQVEDTLIQRTGTWVQQSSDDALSDGYLQSASSVDDTLTMTFTGTQLDIVYVAGVNFGTFVVEIDGQPLRGVNADTPETVFGQVASFANLGEGEHTLRILPLAGATVAIDALVVGGEVLATTPDIDVDTTPVVIPADPTATEETPVEIVPEPDPTETPATDETVIDEDVDAPPAETTPEPESQD